MNRTILNFEATVNSNGLTATGDDSYTVRLYMNHHIIGYWDIGYRDGYLLTQNRAMLDEFVAAKLFEMINKYPRR